ncbi:MAG: hypothetical protein ACR2N7_10900, partial [Acidimicrobiia bacterium]
VSAKRRWTMWKRPPPMILLEESDMRLVVAVHSRDVKTALFLALNGVEFVDIVATATNAAELASYCRSFRPDVAIVETSLPGSPLRDGLEQIEASTGRILLIDPGGRATPEIDVGIAEPFVDVDQLIGALPGTEE